ncbi:MAG: two-component system, OmpR family, copper resistance phosphate regulon response regulator CusR [Acidobacteriaceae bacterium]|jgi:two-component system OmpR family response regulator|nr:two-component system, OmpR family, copper resistance phosphate regulon response regulator CusR [Acidobacteriaceae bacterium]
MKVLTLLLPPNLHKRVSRVLSARQFAVEMGISAKECLRRAALTQYEAVLVDADPANFDDVLVLVKLLRQEQPNAALFVFEHGLDVHRRLSLFDAGVDDCVREPFFASEFAVRLCAWIRLRQAASKLAVPKMGGNVIRSGDLELDLVRRRVARRGKPIDLRSKEFLLLEYLVRNANRSVTRTMILEHVWNSKFKCVTNVVNVHISALRSKLDRDFTQKLIQTNRGIGYTFTCVAAGQPGLAKDFAPVATSDLPTSASNGVSGVRAQGT